MNLIELTKLVNGYQPTRVWVNPTHVIYLEERIEHRGQGDGKFVEVPRGTRVYFGVSTDNAAGFLDVRETPDEVRAILSGTPLGPDGINPAYEAMLADIGQRRQETYEEWEARRERIADAVYGPARD